MISECVFQFIIVPIVTDVSVSPDVLVDLASSPCPLWTKLLVVSKN